MTSGVSQAYACQVDHIKIVSKEHIASGLRSIYDFLRASGKGDVVLYRPEGGDY
jgi:hypothetical protein